MEAQQPDPDATTPPRQTPLTKAEPSGAEPAPGYVGRHRRARPAKGSPEPEAATGEADPAEADPSPGSSEADLEDHLTQSETTTAPDRPDAGTDRPVDDALATPAASVGEEPLVPETAAPDRPDAPDDSTPAEDPPQDRSEGTDPDQALEPVEDDAPAAPAGTPAVTAQRAGTRAPLSRVAHLFRRRGGQALDRHVLEVFAGNPLAARKVDAALARLEPAGTRATVGLYRAELAALLEGAEEDLSVHAVQQQLAAAGVAGHLRQMDEAPLASGAVAHLFRGRDIDDRVVAVKVLRPQVWTALPAQLDAVAAHARTIGAHLPGVDVPVLLDRLRGHVADELDLHGEAARQHAFHVAFTDPLHATADVHVPPVRLASPTVLITGWAEGVPLDQAAPSLSAPARLRAAAALARFAPAAVVRTGMTHGDLHPGNVLVTDDGLVSIVDFGACVRAPARLPDAAAALLKATHDGSERVAVQALRDVGLLPSGTRVRDREVLSGATALLRPVLTDAYLPTGQELQAASAAAAALGVWAPAGAAVACALTVRDALALVGRLGVPIDTVAALVDLPGRS